MVTYTCNPSTWEAEAEGLQVGGQPQHISEALSNLVRTCFKIKKYNRSAEYGGARL